MNKQIFGYTPLQPAGDQYVKFCTAFVTDDGDIVLSVRNEHGVVNDIVLPRSEGASLAAALATHTNVENNP